MKSFASLVFMGLLAGGVSSCRIARQVSLDEVMKMPRFEAVVEDVQIEHPLFLYHGVDIWLTRVDSGKHLDLSICPANDFVLGFARSLHEGTTYSFPDVFGQYVESTPTNTVQSGASP